jgi:hypothetical protein
MNKEFRSYYSEGDYFIYFLNGKYCRIGADNIPVYSMDWAKRFDWGNAEQFTGYTDINNKKIYEGDYFIGEYSPCLYLVVLAPGGFILRSFIKAQDGYTSSTHQALTKEGCIQSDFSKNINQHPINLI